MATRTPTQSQNRQVGYGGGGNSANSVDVGSVAVARMAREDTRWFIVAVVILSLVLFLALPLSMLVYVDTLKMKAEIKHEIKQMEKFKQELKRKEDASNRSGNRSEPD